MKRRKQPGPPSLVVLFCLLAGMVLLAPVPALSGDSIIYFKNGRALRVVEYRKEGDWIFFMLSAPAKTPGKTPAKPVAAANEEDEEDGPSEMGVPRSSIDRIEGARSSAQEVSPNAGIRALADARKRSGGGGGVASMADVPKLDHVASTQPGAPRKTGSVPSMPEPDVEHSVAGQVFNAPLNKLRPPQSILKGAEDWRRYRDRALAEGRDPFEGLNARPWERRVPAPPGGNAAGTSTAAPADDAAAGSAPPPAPETPPGEKQP